VYMKDGSVTHEDELEKAFRSSGKPWAAGRTDDLSPVAA